MLLSLQTIGLFTSAAFLLAVSPGPDNLATLSIGLSRGWRSAVGFGVGCGSGCLFHTAFAVVGVSAAIRSSPVAFTVLKCCGAAYLAWLGLGALRSRGISTIAAEDSRQRTVLQYFGKGLFANAINPKVAIFFLSLLPGFVNEEAGQPELQMAVLGIVFTLVAVSVFSVFGFFSGQIGVWLQSRPGAGLWLDRMTGVLFLVLAVNLVLASV